MDAPISMAAAPMVPAPTLHTLGRALPENSGFDGFQVSQQHVRTFGNQHFINMIEVDWARERAGGFGRVPMEACRKQAF